MQGRPGNPVRDAEGATATLQSSDPQVMQAKALFNKGLGLHRQGKLDDAVQAYSEALLVVPGFELVFNNLGAALNRLGQTGAAIAYIRRAQGRSPASPSLSINLARCLRLAGRLDEAMSEAIRATQMAPEDFGGWHVRALLHRDLQQLPQAMECYDRVLELDPGNREAPYERAVTLLLGEHWRNGFAALESRWQLPGAMPPNPGSNRWQGERIDGKRILVCAEATFSDTIMMARLLPMLRQRCASVALTVPKPLVRLMRSLPGIDVHDAAGPPPPHDVHVPILSLPFLMEIDPPSLATPFPYLSATAAPGEGELPAPLHGARLKIGLCWAGSPAQTHDRLRSIPLTSFTPLLELEHAQFVSLQHGSGSADHVRLALHGLILGDGNAFGDFVTMAAAIRQLDLVITVDTAVAHLAGALGVPAWVLVPYAPDWRWGLNRPDSLWYPSLSLFRQPEPNRWEPVLERMIEALTQLLVSRIRAAGLSERMHAEEGG